MKLFLLILKTAAILIKVLSFVLLFAGPQERWMTALQSAGPISRGICCSRLTDVVSVEIKGGSHELACLPHRSNLFRRVLMRYSRENDKKTRHPTDSSESELLNKANVNRKRHAHPLKAFAACLNFIAARSILLSEERLFYISVNSMNRNSVLQGNPEALLSNLIGVPIDPLLKRDLA